MSEGLFRSPFLASYGVNMTLPLSTPPCILAVDSFSLSRYGVLGYCLLLCYICVAVSSTERVSVPLALSLLLYGSI